jgi:hypothetical protein
MASSPDPLPDPQREEADFFPEIVSQYQEGRDELNLAEFPIAAIGSRLDPSIKTIRFEDKMVDKSTGQLIHRQLTISASDKYGLPTAADDEVLLALLQMSRLQKFATPQVTFTITQLLTILGWEQTTYNRRRVQEAINRWTGVTLYYENAWRDKKSGQWVDASLHLIEYAEFYRQGKDSMIAPSGCSVVKWNDLIFRNFSEGNLKVLDFHLYRMLKSGTAKRLYRFLDKRFYMRSKLSFGLIAFAGDKIGLTRPYKINAKTGTSTLDIAQLKRQLHKGIVELEDALFIVRCPESERFTKDFSGTWQVHFERYVDPKTAVVQPDLGLVVDDVSVLEGRLIGHGVSKAQARRLISEHDDARIEHQLDALEFHLAKGGDNAPKNRAGWLVKAINEDYPAPKGFKSRVQIQQEAATRATHQKRKLEVEARKQQAQIQRQQADESAYQAQQARVDAYLKTLTPQALAELEKKALEGTPAAVGRSGSPLRAAAIRSHVLELLGK